MFIVYIFFSPQIGRGEAEKIRGGRLSSPLWNVVYGPPTRGQNEFSAFFGFWNLLYLQSIPLWNVLHGSEVVEIVLIKSWLVLKLGTFAHVNSNKNFVFIFSLRRFSWELEFNSGISLYPHIIRKRGTRYSLAMLHMGIRIRIEVKFWSGSTLK
jgi:hypothetical protein